MKKIQTAINNIIGNQDKRTLKKEGEGREKTQCEVICQRLMTNMAVIFNPSIEVEPTRMPTRQNPDEVYCQWRFRLEESQ